MNAEIATLANRRKVIAEVDGVNRDCSPAYTDEMVAGESSNSPRTGAALYEIELC